MIKRVLFEIGIIYSLLSSTGNINAANNKTILWNYNQLEEIKKDASSLSIWQDIIDYADYYLTQPLIAVTDKSKSFCKEDSHYYTSIGLYWWPNEYSESGLPYINKDGVVNPEYEEYDYPRLKMLSKRLKYLSLAYFFTKDKRYYKYYVEQLKAWFVNEDTKMYPNFDYAQVIPGRNDNKGRGAGLTEAVEFNSIIESYRLVNCTRKIRRSIQKAIIKWFSDFSDWMETSEIGVSCSKANDNTAICYDVLLLNSSLLAGKTKRAEKLVLEFKDKRINKQVDESGRFPMELKRTKAYYYSVYNLSHIVDFILLARTLGYDLYNDNKDTIDRVVSFLSQYIGNREGFNYNQISEWNSSESMLLYQIDRLSLKPSVRYFYSNDSEQSLIVTPSNRLQYILKYE